MAEDELVTKIVYEVDEESKAVLKEADKQPERIAKSVDKMGKSQKKATVEEKLFAKETSWMNRELRASGKLIGGLDKRLVFLAGGFLGVGAAVGTGMVGMYKFGQASLQAAEKAGKLSNTAFSLQMSPEELQVMGQAFTQLGGSIENFQSDASRYMQMTGNALDVSAIEDLYERLKGLSDKEALNLMRSFGFSDDLTRIVREAGESFGYIAEGIRSTGNALDDDQIKKFKELDAASNALSSTFDRFGDSLYAAAAPTITDGLTRLNNILLGMTGNIANLDNAVSKFNGKPFLENMKSDDLEVRAQALDEAVENLNEQDTIFTGAEAKDKLDEEYVKAERGYKEILEKQYGAEEVQRMKEVAERDGMQLEDGNYTLGRNKGELGGATYRGLHNVLMKSQDPEYEDEEVDPDSIWAGVADQIANDPLLGGMPGESFQAQRLRKNLASSDAVQGEHDALPPAPSEAISGNAVSEREMASFESLPSSRTPPGPDNSSPPQRREEKSGFGGRIDSWSDAMNGMRQPMTEDRYVQLPASQTDIDNHYNTVEGGQTTSSQQTSTTTNTVNVEMHITSPDPQSAGETAAHSIVDVMNEQTNATTMSNGWGQ